MKENIQKLRTYSYKDIDIIPQLKQFSAQEILAMKSVAQVIPFRTNNYVVEQLIDWDNIPDDPIFRLTFPQPEMLSRENFERIAKLLEENTSQAVMKQAVDKIRSTLNPHPDGQKNYNVPKFHSGTVRGVQHKYPETVLVFPSAGQTCHAYCTFCFRWPQFINLGDLKFATRESGDFQNYIQEHKEITDVLLTGGDPMTMKAWQLALYLEPLLGPDFEHIQNIRIGTKSLSYWPYRYVTDPDADEILALFEKIVSAGKHLAIMAHFNHWKELETPVVQEAIRRIRSTGACIRTQSPLVNHINNLEKVWVKMWKKQVKLGCIPYYMFVERQTGAKNYFEIPIFRAWEIFQGAIQKVSGLSRTVRGPVMSALPGKIIIDGIAEINNEKVFVLSFLQARNPDWCKRPFFAKFDPESTWLTTLKPAFGKEKFFFDSALEEMKINKQLQLSQAIK
ncbi:KamA family radical SAM protein [Mastigocoleus testarum]|uniref:Lysine 2,3-aminomutase n=1 Tax=Mastigocoleus testarum BC008 TaxID=371196 RepID=A0A0V8A0S3_9CYAN|nr:hypothetical protein [Mastigocoleus testarum]KST70380.1 lysine 2,3-aminomutase [Mastigocoleus testarum BC008]